MDAAAEEFPPRYVGEVLTCFKCAARARAERKFGEAAIPSSWDGAKTVVHDRWEDGQPPGR